MLRAPGDPGSASSDAEFIQALAAKSLETVRLTEVLTLSREDEAARAALAAQLADLQRSAGELGFAHLETAVAEALGRLEQESFGPASLIAVRGLAWRYESLAALPSQSGTHPVLVGEQPLAEPSLRGRRVLVADDEAQVRWFYVGVLREGGARVTEARDGVHALERAREDAPDLILADIVMPRLDGLGLCAAVRREPVLDGVPVVLLSWRDDFLQVPARHILDRVSRALEPLTRLEESLKGDREARGDLEELGVSVLLRATRRLRSSASIVLQDPWSLFDVELHEGRIVGVTRTAIDGTVTRGAAALPALVGMSSGRFVVGKMAARQAGEERESLDASFAHAARRLGVLLSRMAAHTDCRVELDQALLGTYVRHSPIVIQRLIARLLAGEPPDALWESGAGSRSLVDAILVTLARQGAIRDVTVPTYAEPSPDPIPELKEPEIAPHSPPVADPLERENVRAQSAVAMHREPANHAPKWTHPIWRLNVGAGAGRSEISSGFGMDLQTTPRVLGLGFAMLLSATVGFLIWLQVMPGPASKESPSVATAPKQTTVADEQVAPNAPVEVPLATPSRLDLSAFAGQLRAGVDPSLEVTEGQGALEVSGPSDVSVEVDGVGRGALPVTVVLEEGRHSVRYRVGAKSTYRFYFVKSGATRELRVVAQPGGLVDAR